MESPCSSFTEHGDSIHHALLLHECVKIEGVVYIHFIAFNGASREIGDLLVREVLDRLTWATPIRGELQDGMFALLRIKLEEAFE